MDGEGMELGCDDDDEELSIVSNGVGLEVVGLKVEVGTDEIVLVGAVVGIIVGILLGAELPLKVGRRVGDGVWTIYGINLKSGSTRCILPSSIASLNDDAYAVFSSAASSGVKLPDKLTKGTFTDTFTHKSDVGAPSGQSVIDQSEREIGIL